MQGDISITDVITMMGVLVSLIFGCVNIYQMRRTMGMSNKQELFDKRFDIYNLVSTIDKLCREALRLLDDHEDVYSAIDYIACCLTNAAYLKDLQHVFYERNSDNQNLFLSIIENIRREADKSKLLFPDQYGYISDYLNRYADLLNEMHKYKCLLRQVDDVPNQVPRSKVMEAQKDILNGDVEKDLHNNIDFYVDELNKLCTDYADWKVKLDEFMKLNKVS